MPICYVNSDGSHVRGCDRHAGQHPYDCDAESERRRLRIIELQEELTRLRTEYVECFQDSIARGLH